MLYKVMRRSAAAYLLRLWVRMAPKAWMFICCEYCVLSGRSICDELIARPGESYQLWCVVVCDLKTRRSRSPGPTLGRSATETKSIRKCSFLMQIMNYYYVIVSFAKHIIM